MMTIKSPNEKSFLEGLEKIRQIERKRMLKDIEQSLERPLEAWEIDFIDLYLERVAEEFDNYIVYGGKE